MTTKHISVAEARARLAAILDGVRSRGERYVLERHGREVAAIVGVEELARLDRPSAEPPMGAMALVGLWHEVTDTDIDALLADIYAERERDAGRPVEHAS